MTEARWRLLSRIAMVTFGAEVIFWIITRTADALTTPLEFNGFPADGPFQTFNPLRRIAAGQHGGLDFQFFHGMGVPYVLYPLYALGGKTIFSAEFSRHIVSLAFFLVALSIFYAASRNFVATLVSTAAVLPLSIPFESLYLPGNSLLAIRSTVPVLFAAVLMFPMRRSVRLGLSAILMAVSLFLGTEHGMALIAALGVMEVLRAIKHRSVRPLFELAVSVAAAICGYLLALIAIGGLAGCRNALRFAFREVPADQFWYFGSPPNSFLGSWYQVFHDADLVPVVGTSALIAIAVVALFWRARDERDERMLYAVTLLMFYGLVTCVAYLGIAYHGYFQPLRRAILFGLVALGAYVAVVHAPRWKLSIRRRATLGLYVIVTVLVAADFWMNLSDVTILVIPRYREYVAAGRHPRLSMRWQWDLDIGRRAIGIAPGAAKPIIWSTYAGLIEDQYGVFNPECDYIIHALGPEARRAYVEDFRRVRPENVQTLRRTLFKYEEGIRTFHWDFYGEVLRTYRIVGVTSHSLWWKLGRRTPLLEHKIGSIRIAGEQQFVPVALPPYASHYAIAVLSLRYHVLNPWARVPIAGQLSRHLVVVRGAINRYPIALSPYRTETQIPIFLEQGQRPVVGIITKSLMPGTSVIIESAAVSLVELDAENELLLASPFAGGRVPPVVNRDFR